MKISSLADTEVEGMFFKDEGDFVTVKFDKSTKQPALPGKMYPFGSLLPVHITNEDIKEVKTPAQLKQVVYKRFEFFSTSIN